MWLYGLRGKIYYPKKIVSNTNKNECVGWSFNMHLGQKNSFIKCEWWFNHSEKSEYKNLELLPETIIHAWKFSLVKNEYWSDKNYHYVDSLKIVINHGLEIQLNKISPKKQNLSNDQTHNSFENLDEIQNSNLDINETQNNVNLSDNNVFSKTSKSKSKSEEQKRSNDNWELDLTIYD